MDRRQFLASAASLGIVGVWATRSAAAPSRVAWREDRASVSPGRRVGRSRRAQRDPVDPAAVRPGRAARADGGSGARCGLPQRRRHRARAGAGGGRLDVPRAGRRPLAGDDLLVPLHRRQRRRQPGRAHDHRAARHRPAPGPLRLRLVQQRQRRRAERLSPDDLGGRARARRPQARLRAPPRRLHLRSRRISRRGIAPLFAHRLRPRPHPRRAQGQQIFHVPTNLAGYRHVYRAHIDDPDIQDARAHFPFVCIGDNHEFSWQGWQSFIKYPGSRSSPRSRCASPPIRRGGNISRRASARRRARGSTSSARPRWRTRRSTTFDDHGFGTEANNRTAVGSMTAYRAMRYGKHVDLILTDFHSYKAADPTERPEADVVRFGHSRWFRRS